MFDYTPYLSVLQLEKATNMQADYWTKNKPYTILLSPTGSGKTLAFEIQLLKFLANNENSHIRILVICPTRELAQQGFKNWQNLKTNYKAICCYGGHNFKDEVAQLQGKPNIIFGTPGRILDHLLEHPQLLNNFEHLIIDEYDKTLEMGFMQQIDEIIDYAASPLQSIQLISATTIEKLPLSFENYSFETYDYIGESSQPKFSYIFMQSKGKEKVEDLYAMLCTLGNKGKTLVFCTHRAAVGRIVDNLDRRGLSVLGFHGAKEQDERELALTKFRNGSINILVCTDLAARGLDIPEIEHIIHYQYPQTEAEFVHRNGRTARMQAEGNIYMIHNLEEDNIPEYYKNLNATEFILYKDAPPLKESDWQTIRLTAGRKDKIRKIDIVGFFMQSLNCKQEDLGMIEVKDDASFVAIKKSFWKGNKVLLEKFKIKKITVKSRPV